MLDPVKNEVKTVIYRNWTTASGATTLTRLENSDSHYFNNRINHGTVIMLHEKESYPRFSKT